MATYEDFLKAVRYAMTKADIKKMSWFGQWKRVR
jgi:hypothetical protein